MRGLAALLAGLVFGIGLAMSDMTNPHKVINFLDLAGHWDASLLLVLVGATAVYALGFQLVQRTPRPVLEPRFRLPTSKRIDAPLLLGALVFGVGWGLAGFCPGPGIARIGIDLGDLAWLPGMALGLWLAGVVRR